MMDNPEQKKDIATAKKTKDKSIKKKSKKTKKKKKTKVGGVTININVGGGGKSATKQPKAPRAARGFVPRSTSLRGQQKVQRNVDDKFGRETGNLWQGVYGVRSQVTGLSGDVDTIRSKVDFLGNYILNSRQQPASVQHRVPPQNITLNVPNPPGIEDMRRVADTIINNQATASRAIDQLSANMEASTENIAAGIMYTAKEVEKLSDGTNAANSVATLYDVEESGGNASEFANPLLMEIGESSSAVQSEAEQPEVQTVKSDGTTQRKKRTKYSDEDVALLRRMAMKTNVMEQGERSKFYSTNKEMVDVLNRYDRRATINKLNSYRKGDKPREEAETTLMGSEDK
tara:strand:+ start:2877 stop:3908 length:1032 start_codon:yes stop_codon:yes gene_type:complete